MTVLATVDFDNLTDATTITNTEVPASWFTYGTAFTARTAAAIHGTTGARVDDVASNAQVQWQRGTSSTATVCQSYYWRLIDHPGRSYFGILSSSGTQHADWRIDADLKVAIRDGFSAVATSAESLTVGTTYRSEWLCAVGTQELRIFEGESTTPLITLTGTLTDNSHDRINFGVTSGGLGRDFEMDTLRIADDWTGPFAAPPGPTSLWHLVTGEGTSIPLGNPVIVP